MKRYLGSKVTPFRVDRFNKPILPFAFPVLELFLASDGLFNVGKYLKIYKLVAIVFPGENTATALSVFYYTSSQVVGNAYV